MRGWERQSARITNWAAAAIIALPFATTNVRAQYLTGADRASFVTGVVNGCVRKKDGDALTAQIPVSVIDQYCKCYANGLADRASMSDLRANDPTVMRSIIQAEGKRCYEATRKALSPQGNGRVEAKPQGTDAASRDALKDAFEAANKKDYANAFKLFRPLAEKGNALAQGMLGHMYSNGDGVQQDDKAAVTWWKRAAEQGEPMSQFMLGKSLMSGQGVGENFGEGAKWLRKAAEQNIPEAQAGLGLALSTGQGIKVDKSEAVKWFAKAAEKNQVLAQAQLSAMYYNGEGGLEKSLVEADKWAIIAGDAAFLIPPKFLIESVMTNAQKREAIHLAEQWKFDRGLTKTPPPPIGTDNVRFFFVKMRELVAKCSNMNDTTWCGAYIAGVIDTLGANRRDLNRDAENARFCLGKRMVSLAQAREAVGKVLALTKEQKDFPLLDDAASNSVIAAVLAHLCD